MQRLFGTDGVRGRANEPPMTPEVAYELGRAAGYVFQRYGADTVLIGRDGRLSGDMLECALVAGLCAVGTSVCRAGIVPTPAISHLTGVLSAQLGVMISASHNPVADNGIKFFNRDGTKIDDELEREIEHAYAERSHQDLHPTGAAIGRVVERTNVVERYLAHVRQAAPPGFDLSGLTIVVDGANGAQSEITPQLLEEYGAQVFAINCTPDGLNINEGCGSTHLAPLQLAVKTHLADVGLAHDGDGDRTLFVDERGTVLDGDYILAICGLYLQQLGRLTDDVIVTTVLGNKGLDLSLQPHGIRVVRSPVGDRFVWEKMREVGAALGGEQAGHVIFSEFAHTGDGVITALHMLAAMLDDGRPLSQMAQVLTVLPQAVRNLRVVSKPPLEDCPAIIQALGEVEETLGDRGRIILRYSGTEPLARIMIEGEDETQIGQLADRMAEVLAQELHGTLA
ncbi:phosphoglucosamine mutase [bacterium]|nr:phosphoglucosamine mutase [bacterium]